MFEIGSLFTGIGGFDLGLERVGMNIAWQCEQDESCVRVLRQRFPNAEIHRDVRELDGKSVEPIQLLCGGFPCQDLSVAGRRAGLAGERSGLFHEFMRLVDECSPDWLLLENVPGLLSSNDGRDMGTVLREVAKRGYWWTYRVLDSQYFGLAQRRKRVFIVGCRRNRTSAAKVLFDAESLRGNPAPSQETESDVAGTLEAGAGVRRGGGQNPGSIAPILEATARQGNPNGSSVGIGKPGDPMFTLQAGKQHAIAATLNSGGNTGGFRTEPGEHLVAYQCHGSNVGPLGTIRSGNGNESGGVPFVAEGFHPNASASQTINPARVCPTLDKSKPAGVIIRGGVRRLMPEECELLQGFPRGWTDVEGTSDSARYRQLGNAVSVPVAEWIGRRITEVANV